MMKNILQKLSSFGTAPPQFDPAIFKDEIALKTEWTPAKGGGANFRTHKLIEISPYRIEFHSSVGAKIFYSLFMVFGLGFGIVFAAIELSEGELSIDIEKLMPILFGLLFFAVGALMLYFGTTPIVFDRASGYFWKGRKTPQDVLDWHSLKNVAQIGEIHALQILAEYIRGSKSSYYSYELNIVLRDGKRLNVVDHGNLNKLREDAKTLSVFLGKAVWDATEISTRKTE